MHIYVFAGSMYVSDIGCLYIYIYIYIYVCICTYNIYIYLYVYIYVHTHYLHEYMHTYFGAHVQKTGSIHCIAFLVR